jgi:hypothetical protein
LHLLDQQVTQRFEFHEPFFHGDRESLLGKRSSLVSCKNYTA